jgi:SAM-dependent methyltransferase
VDERDRQNTIARYEARLGVHGRSPEALGWGKSGKQDVRFAILAADALAHPDWSVLDVGCGFADLYDFLTERGWRGRYTGIDLVPGLLAQGRARHPQLDLRERDITQAGIERHDVVVASGIANARLEHGDNADHTTAVLRALFAHARRVAAMDFLSTYVDFRREEAWHTDPQWAFALGKTLSRRVALRHDYLPFEFALLIYRDDTVRGDNAFAGET